MRVIPDKNKIREGYLYAYLASKYGKLLLTTGTYGTVIPTLNSDSISSIPIPKIPDSLQKEIDCLVQDAASLRESADDNLKQADFLLKQSAKLKNLTVDDYEYFGQHISGRKVACFSRNIKEIGTISFNAFNHSEKIKTLKASISCTTMPLCDVLEGGNTFSTGAFPRIEVKSQRGIMLVNQSDIFDTIISGKLISRRNVNTSKLVEYGEVLIAGVGTLGEGETFCRVIFANEDLEGQLVSGELIRMKTNSIIPSGYLYAWLNSDYGFRLLRSIQAGTKLCRPIPILLQMLPVPILADSDMIEVDRLVRDAHSKRHVANIKETKAIMLVENEISGW